MKPLTIEELKALSPHDWVWLQDEKWAITVGAVCVKGKEDYLVECMTPKANYWGGKWHTGYESINCRAIIFQFDTEKEAEARLAELKGEK